MGFTNGFRRSTRTLALLSALTLSLAAAACSSGSSESPAAQPTTVPQPDPDKPAVLLVHGAFADGSSWGGVVEQLQRKGFRVTTAAVPLRGLEYDSAYIRGILDAMPGKTLLVGHSYGGAVITNAAAGSPKAAGLVYVAAFAPDQGESLGELDGRFGGPATKITLPQTVPGSPAPELVIDTAKFPEYFAQDVPPVRAAVLAAGQRPISVAAFTETTGAPAWRTLPSWYLVAADDRMIPPAGQREMAARAKATVTEHAGSHAIAVSHPETVVTVIDQAAGTLR
ncbi:alpha/beta hydrolase [Nocardia sp. 2]|uniref:Alpha/beta hydrolase n=1 Tax=Nocardia acididurans TaxID=2802282 RepID=A0ABS1MFD6_9NOCA|nr:alpha/beta hydrolase [Nocardia acididurans]MBL1079271.1 alpha/beta hydrolase [Nocardia acididurans]